MKLKMVKVRGKSFLESLSTALALFLPSGSDVLAGPFALACGGVWNWKEG